MKEERSKELKSTILEDNVKKKRMYLYDWVTYCTAEIDRTL